MTSRPFSAQATLWSRIVSFGVGQYLVYMNTRCICIAVCLAIFGFGWVSFASKASYDWLLALGVWDHSHDHEEKGVDPGNIARTHRLNDLLRSGDSVPSYVP